MSPVWATCLYYCSTFLSVNSSELISSLRNGFRHAFVKYFDANDRKFPRLLTVVFFSLLVSCSCSLMRTLSNAQFSCRLIFLSRPQVGAKTEQAVLLNYCRHRHLNYFSLLEILIYFNIQLLPPAVINSFTFSGTWSSSGTAWATARQGPFS